MLIGIEEQGIHEMTAVYRGVELLQNIIQCKVSIVVPNGFDVELQRVLDENVIGRGLQLSSSGGGGYR